MAIKVDLEKAYDRLKWDFIKDTLMDIGLPEKIVDVIRNCTTSSSMRMLWNGEALDEFLPSRGIRQGDPLSPYLFILCIERLFQMIGLAVKHNLWKPICLTKGGPKLSHFAFADDLLLFTKASLEQVHILQTIMDLFCKISRQKISKDKSSVFFSKNVSWHVKISYVVNLVYNGRMISVDIFVFLFSIKKLIKKHIVTLLIK